MKKIRVCDLFQSLIWEEDSLRSTDEEDPEEARKKYGERYNREECREKGYDRVLRLTSFFSNCEEEISVPPELEEMLLSSFLRQ